MKCSARNGVRKLDGKIQMYDEAGCLSRIIPLMIKALCSSAEKYLESFFGEWCIFKLKVPNLVCEKLLNSIMESRTRDKAGYTVELVI